MPIKGNLNGLKPEVLEKLEKLPDEFKKRYPDSKSDIILSSGLRDAKSDKLQGLKESAHWYGLAVDIVIPGLETWDIADLLESVGFNGVFEYYNSDGTSAYHAHGDVRGEPSADGTEYAKGATHGVKTHGAYQDIGGGPGKRKWKRCELKKRLKTQNYKPYLRISVLFDYAYVVELQGIDTGEKCMGDHKNPWSVGCVYGVTLGQVLGGWIRTKDTGDWMLDPCAVHCGIWKRIKKLIGKVEFDGKIAINTPAGTTTANGTGYSLNVLSDGTNIIEVYDGEVLFTAKNSSLIKSVSAGQKLSFCSTTGESMLSPIDRNLSDKFNDWVRNNVLVSDTDDEIIYQDAVVELPSGSMFYFSPAEESQDLPLLSLPVQIIKYRDMQYKLFDIHTSVEFESRSAPPGKVFLIVNVEIKNESSSMQFVSYDEEIGLIAVSSKESTDDKIISLYNYSIRTDFEPGQEAKGIFLFVVPREARKLQLVLGRKEHTQTKLPITPVEY